MNNIIPNIIKIAPRIRLKIPLVNSGVLPDLPVINKTRPTPIAKEVNRRKLEVSVIILSYRPTITDYHSENTKSNVIFPGLVDRSNTFCSVY